MEEQKLDLEKKLEEFLKIEMTEEDYRDGISTFLFDSEQYKLVRQYLTQEAEEKGGKQALIDFIDKYVKTEYMAELFIYVKSGVKYSSRGDDMSWADRDQVWEKYEQVCIDRKLDVESKKSQ